MSQVSFSQAAAVRDSSPENPDRNGELSPFSELANHGFLDVFPSSVRILGKDASPLSTDDYTDWLREETDKTREKRKAILTTQVAMASPKERFQILANIQDTEIIPDDIIDVYKRNEWIRKIVGKVMENAGFSIEEKAAFFKTPAKYQEVICAYASGLFSNYVLEQMYGRLFGPFDGRLLSVEGVRSTSGSMGDSANTPTGTSTGSSLSEKPVEMSAA